MPSNEMLDLIKEGTETVLRLCTQAGLKVTVFVLNPGNVAEGMSVITNAIPGEVCVACLRLALSIANRQLDIQMVELSSKDKREWRN